MLLKINENNGSSCIIKYAEVAALETRMIQVKTTKIKKFLESMIR